MKVESRKQRRRAIVETQSKSGKPASATKTDSDCSITLECLSRSLSDNLGVHDLMTFDVEEAEELGALNVDLEGDIICRLVSPLDYIYAVSYTHLTLPTIYPV